MKPYSCSSTYDNDLNVENPIFCLNRLTRRMCKQVKKDEDDKSMPGLQLKDYTSTFLATKWNCVHQIKRAQNYHLEKYGPHSPSSLPKGNMKNSNLN